MTIKATINQITNEELYHGEDKDFTVYFYNATTFEPVDLTSYTGGINFCFKNTDASTATFAGNNGGTDGKSTFTVTNAEASLLEATKQYLQVSLIDASAKVNIEVLTNYIEVKEKNC